MSLTISLSVLKKLLLQLTTTMDTSVLIVVYFLALFALLHCQDLHLIERKPGLCFKIHTPDQPHFYPNPRKPDYPNLFESCTEWLGPERTCLGLRTQNHEVLVLHCRGASRRRRPGCYKIINRDKREEIVCQKVHEEEGCEIITTRTNLTIVVACEAGRISSRSSRGKKRRRPK